MTGVVCNDNRFEIIEKYKNKLIEITNIETAKDEMAVIDSILYRFWQMGWLDKLEDYNRQKAEIEEQHRKIDFLQASKDLNQAEFDEVKIELELKKAELKKYDQIKTTINEFWDILLKHSIAKRKESPTLEELADGIHELEVNAIKEFSRRIEFMLSMHPAQRRYYEKIKKEYIKEN